MMEIAEYVGMIEEGLTLVLGGGVGLLIVAVMFWMRQNLREKEMMLVMWIIGLAVEAAEQLGGDGAEKKRAAVEIVQKWFNYYGIKLDVGRIGEGIESVVWERLNYERYKPARDVPGGG
ncbi:MAG: phage holin, LLH family [Chloroflexota bacterium]